MSKLLIILLGIFALSGCFGPANQDTNEKQAAQTERMIAEANNRIGLPNITKFTEKRFAKMIYELRDQEVATYTYIIDINGNSHFLCESIGFGLPYSVQYVNPQVKVYQANGGTISLPQPEPNGLFMPDSLSATWVLCSDGKGNVKPVYSEPSLIVSPFPLKEFSTMRK